MQRSEDEKQVKALSLSLSKSVLVGSGISGICNTSLWCQVTVSARWHTELLRTRKPCVNTYWGGVLFRHGKLENRVTGQIGLNSDWTWMSVKSYMGKKIMCVWSMYIKMMKQQSEWQIKLPKMQNMVPSHKHKHTVPSPIFFMQSILPCAWSTPMEDNAKQ